MEMPGLDLKMKAISPDASSLEQVRAAWDLVKQDRRQGWARLNQLFCDGTPPDPAPEGEYSGKLLGLNIAPIYTQFASAIASLWMPWKGKYFDAGHARGENIFSNDARFSAHILWPFYRYYQKYGPDTYLAFPFRTYIGPGKADPDREVLKIDYSLQANPRLNVRRVLDELVQLSPGF